jgi:hypothetical protein
MSRVSKRNKMAADYHIKMWIYQRDNKRCRWCDVRVDFRLSMIVCHGLSVSLYPTYDDIDNWFTGCQECNSRAGKFSFPPNPIVPEVVSVPQLDDLITEVKRVVALMAPSQVEWQPPPEDIELLSQPVTMRVQDEYDPIKQFEAELAWRQRG